LLGLRVEWIESSHTIGLKVVVTSTLSRRQDLRSNERRSTDASACNRVLVQLLGRIKVADSASRNLLVLVDRDEDVLSLQVCVENAIHPSIHQSSMVSGNDDGLGGAPLHAYLDE